jgi:hypothetical protein
LNNYSLYKVLEALFTGDLGMPDDAVVTQVVDYMLESFGASGTSGPSGPFVSVPECALLAALGCSGATLGESPCGFTTVLTETLRRLYEPRGWTVSHCTQNACFEFIRDNVATA